ncbi:ferredoxin reductase family protein [Roseicitreum antarcticum]|uniref:Predicted ferric reductase n=1 Tax=Roseicitreum antarcticum TaxID=564137 RepID=A0A1H2YIH1_9RHOB|nr:ferredoxin reductase family protein [Roseicitreum antarcticum]SDX04781.1 Predicted ferric reductase [Roseicitreum antarcticum]
MTDLAQLAKNVTLGPVQSSICWTTAVGKVLNLSGPLLVASLCVLAGLLGFTTYASYGSDAAIGIAVGAAAVVAMSQTLILAARPRLLEPLFGGLDRMYRVHKWLGISAMVLMILHQQIEPDFERTVRETGLGELAEEAGEFAFNALLVLIAISWFRRLPFIPLEIPYQIWRFSHRFMGVLFSVIVFHQFFVDMPTGVDPSLSVMLNTFGLGGVIAWLHTEFVAPRLRRREYTVSDISRHGDTTALTLSPNGRAMRWRPGQFAFFRAPEAGFSEPHPFTIASAPRPDGALTLSIKGLGGWTRRLPDALRTGMSVQVEGPYGRFDFRKGGARQIWLAGGIGITPFLAWAESLTEAERRNIHLVYCVRTPEEEIGVEILQAAAARNPRFSYQVVATERDGRLTAERLTGMVPFAVRGADLWFCGPKGLKDGILKGLKALDQTPRRVRFEHFEFA